MKRQIRVLVIDDSAFSRRSITKMLDGYENISVAGYAVNGEDGIRKVIELKPDVVTLDLDLPGIDGFTLLRILTSRFTMIQVIVVSAINGADNVFKALEQGAIDFVAKPSGMATERLLEIGQNLRRSVIHAAHTLQSCRFTGSVAAHVEGEKPESSREGHGKTPCPIIPFHFDIVAIGASTGGPPALQHVLSAFDQRMPFPVVIAQHMPSGFTKAFAERLNRASPFHVTEAIDGDPVEPGTVLVAPGGMNLRLEEFEHKVVARVAAPSPEDRYVPSVDVLFDSCARIYGRRMIAVILTGMGSDGSKGIVSVKRRGGFIMAESKESAVVYGMPREAVATGAVDLVLPLEAVAREIIARSALT